MYRALFHIDEMAKWHLLLKNVKNFTAGMGRSEVSAEVVANSEAVKFYGVLPGDGDGALMRELSEAGIKFTACHNALRDLGVDEKSLPSFVQVVPAGVTELVIRQSEGYAYIKP